MQKDNNALDRFDSTLINLLHEIDAVLEERFGAACNRHPARPPQGATANPQYDGLFTVSSNFTAGIGSTYGPGYALSIRLSTLMPVDEALREQCDEIMVTHLRKRLPEVFPNRHLMVDKDNHGWKLHGDLSLN